MLLLYFGAAAVVGFVTVPINQQVGYWILVCLGALAIAGVI